VKPPISGPSSCRRVQSFHSDVSLLDTSNCRIAQRMEGAGITRMSNETSSTSANVMRRDNEEVGILIEGIPNLET